MDGIKLLMLREIRQIVKLVARRQSSVASYQSSAKEDRFGSVAKCKDAQTF